jgi:hypothetical protein
MRREVSAQLQHDDADRPLRLDGPDDAVGVVFWTGSLSGDVGIFDLMENPRSFPYPDSMIWWLNDWYDKRYPAPPGFINLHGEIDRVRWTFLVVFVPSALASLILLQLVVAPWIYPRSKRVP